MTDTDNRVREELEQLRQVLVKMLGRPSRWSGLVELTDNPYIRGAKPFRCDILINSELAGQDECWRTLIHEMLHSFSAGYLPQDYMTLRGWEEGVIENLQRVLRPAVLAELGVAVSEAVFHSAEAGHEYAEYVQALEDIHLTLGEESLTFYVDLLAVPLGDRQRTMFEAGMRLPTANRQAFFRIYSRSDAVLKGGTRA